MEKGFEREVLDRLTKIETKLDDYNTMKEKTDDAHNLSIQNERDIDEIKDKIKWLSLYLVSTAQFFCNNYSRNCKFNICINTNKS